ncbi:I78 family peptidase inhibitor [Erythrobacter sp. LQ02-29]|uniref:I78 family peptidase inhibitor n=1 Tax=unclassified Erythrobacter TaxID=2633097 RepID=UPI001BFC53F7|nr:MULTISPECIES: I78 family peptidase inhibitor [unclassified Erythrobacter]MCP9223088.1 I78 family peptidase inhibitor [Erythrobacter sp. LQ02-29]QWC55727.1 hypothetical protein F7D01_00300 [Erythrobacter sp. 3-20A1M]
MRIPSSLAAGLPLLLLAACGQAVPVNQADSEPLVEKAPVADYDRDIPDPGTSPEAVESDDCHAQVASAYVGREADAETRGRLLTDIAPITNVRWMSPGDPTPEPETVPQRLNVELGEDGKIVSVACG